MDDIFAVDIQTCRFCKGDVQHPDYVKYSVRHYAHFACFLERKGQRGLLGLTAWQVGRFPLDVLKKFGLNGVAKMLLAQGKPPKGVKTIKAGDLSRMAFSNDPKMPQVVNMNGKRHRWVGIGWVPDGELTGKEVVVIE